MKKRMLWTKKSPVPMLLALVLSIVMVSVGTTSSVSAVTQTNSTTTVYLDPPTINATAADVGQTFTVNINISNAINVSDWGIGLTFNPTLLECTSFSEGEFLKNVGTTLWTPGTIDNTAGIVTVYGCNFLGLKWVNGSGRLAYATFRVKAPGISDIHLRDTQVLEREYDPLRGYYVPVMVPFNIIDVYTVVVGTTYHTIVTVSNSVGKTGTYSSGFYGHAFSLLDKEISFNVTGPKLGFSNVTIPKTLLNVTTLDELKVIIDGTPVSRTVTYNGTHHSLYFTYTLGIHKVQITNKRELVVSLEAPVWLPPGDLSLLNATVYNFGVNDETNVTLQLLIEGAIVNSTVISLLPVDQNYTLSYNWTAPMVEAVYNVTAYAPPVFDEKVVDNNVATKFVMVGRLFIDPPSGSVGTETTVTGAGFPNQTQVLVTFNDMLMGYAMTNDVGKFTYVFNVPISAAGIQKVKAFEALNLSNYAVTNFTVIDVTPLDIEIDVGSTHFRGELAEFYIQITFKGTAVNATSISALLCKPDGTTEALTVPQPIATGFYKITYAVPGDAQNGTYALVIEASYATSTIEAYGTSFKTFLLSQTLTDELALIEDLEEEIEDIEGDIAALNATLNSISQTLTQLETDIEGDIAALNATLNSISQTLALLETRINNIKSAQDAFTAPLYGAMALALIAAVGAILASILIRRKTPA